MGWLRYAELSAKNVIFFPVINTPLTRKLSVICNHSDTDARTRPVPLVQEATSRIIDIALPRRLEQLQVEPAENGRQTHVHLTIRKPVRPCQYRRVAAGSANIGAKIHVLHANTHPPALPNGTKQRFCCSVAWNHRSGRNLDGSRKKASLGSTSGWLMLMAVCMERDDQWHARQPEYSGLLLTPAGIYHVSYINSFSETKGSRDVVAARSRSDSRTEAACRW